MTELGPPRVLVSFFYFGKPSPRRGTFGEQMELVFRSHPRSIMLDSGAFSAHGAGTSIDVDEYAAWVNEHAAMFDTIVNLDVLYDPDTTWSNQLRLEDATQQPILPVVHFGAPPALLDRYLDAGHRYVSLGGMVGNSGRKRMRWLIQMHRIARDAGAVLHGLGLTTWVEMRSFPWYSVDSTSWRSGGRWGRLDIFDEQRGRLVSVDTLGRRKAGRHRATIYSIDAARNLRALGFDTQRDDAANGYAISASSYRRAEAWLRANGHGVVHRPDSGADGIRIYLATAEARQLAYVRGPERLTEIAEEQG